MSSSPYPVKAKEGVIPRSTKDVLSGTAGGIAQVLVGQPLDIVKVRLQTSPPGTFTGMADCARQLVKHEGPLAFYKGTLTPLLGVGLCVSIQFGVFERMKREFQAINAKKFGDQSYLNKGLSSSQLYLAGSAAGLSNAVVAGPVEQIRIRLQTQKNNQFKGPLDCARQIIRASGVSGIFRGMIPTFAREGHGMGCYFLTYEYLVQQLLAKTGKTRSEMPAIYAVLFGASSGLAVWLSAYPFDIIKSQKVTVWAAM
ncbi:mitochondrial carrier [Ceraceosorus bombacis]|uniref:Mitochondrial carrier n=1 Tax=Ceraceosorus bombacis TaxID=401625 RepID=A0A0P1BCT3_9BASI|nr:mitochondrial carrier [Ceraceosorus bombacis]